MGLTEYSTIQVLLLTTVCRTTILAAPSFLFLFMIWIVRFDSNHAYSDKFAFSLRQF